MLGFAAVKNENFYQRISTINKFLVSQLKCCILAAGEWAEKWTDEDYRPWSLDNGWMPSYRSMPSIRDHHGSLLQSPSPWQSCPTASDRWSNSIPRRWLRGCQSSWTLRPHLRQSGLQLNHTRERESWGVREIRPRTQTWPNPFCWASRQRHTFLWSRHNNDEGDTENEGNERKGCCIRLRHPAIWKLGSSGTFCIDFESKMLNFTATSYNL